MQLFNILLGLILLTFGRKLFWLLVGIAGFIVGMEFAGMFLAGHPYWLVLLAGILTGLLGAWLALFAQRLAFALAGFYAGSFLTLILAQSLALHDPAGILLPVMGGLIGAFLSAWIMDPALIILSCLIGAATIVNAMNAGMIVSSIIFVLLLCCGIFVQTKLLPRLKKEE
ncbi:MAG: DUF4203 domain-containing protein [Deltaproteobacteria bacterium]|nr:DUF4203 domain-containing protein [Deltaproteobacteria bacterium]